MSYIGEKMHRVALISGSANKNLSENVANILGIKLVETELTTFKDGEVYCRILEDIRGKYCFVLQPTCRDVNKNLMELAILLDAAKRSYAKKIIAVLPYFGYARQDRQAKENEPISAKLVAKLIEAAGAERLITIDLHSAQIEGFFDITIKHLSAVPLLAEYFSKLKGEDVLIVAPDAGSTKRAHSFAKMLGSGMAIIDKRRDRPNEVSEAVLVGDVTNKICILVDDMIDTAGTITKAAEELSKKGAKETYICATHAVFSDPAIERLEKSKAKEVVVTDTIPHKNLPSKIKVVSVAGIIADAIKNMVDEI